MVRGTARQVWNGTCELTGGGLRKSDLVRVKKGTRLNAGGKRVPVYAIVSKKKRELGQKNKWALAVKAARKKLKITGFQPLNKESQLYKETLKIYKKQKNKTTRKKKKK
jgi:hypothetical protein